MLEATPIINLCSFLLGIMDGLLIFSCLGMLAPLNAGSRSLPVAWCLIAIICIAPVALSSHGWLNERGASASLLGCHLLLGALAVLSWTLASYLLKRGEEG